MVMIMQLPPAWKHHNDDRDDQSLQDYGVNVYRLRKKEKESRLTDWLTIDLCCY